LEPSESDVAILAVKGSILSLMRYVIYQSDEEGGQKQFSSLRKISALSLENIIDHVSLFETLVHSWRKTHRNLIIQMYNEITNSITICTTKVFNISEHWISIKLQNFLGQIEYVSKIYCTKFVACVHRLLVFASRKKTAPKGLLPIFSSGTHFVPLKFQINWRYYEKINAQKQLRPFSAFIHSWTKSVYLQTNELFFNSQPALQQQHHVVHKTTRWKMKKHDEIKCTMFPFYDDGQNVCKKRVLQIYIFSAFAALSTYFIFIHLCFYWMLFNSQK
jgi:hypothetical protein